VLVETDEAEAYEAWNMAMPAVPPRSELYCLTPIGVGSVQVEGLASYVMRLAEAHHVGLEVMAGLVGAYLPMPDRWYRVSAFRVERLCERWRKKAGLEVTLRDWVWAIEKLTLRTNLCRLTMLEWAEVIDLRSVYRYLRTWCPSCYEEWAVTGQPFYEPLLWNIREVRLCLRHLQPLRRECNHCHRSQCLVLSTSRVGYCGQCGGWLGASEGRDTLLEGLDPERQRWIAINIAELISATSESRQLRREQVTTRLRDVEKRNRKLFFKWPIAEVEAFLCGRGSLSLAFLLDICWKLDVGLCGFLGITEE
jgi:hypothetical protein